MVPEFWEVFDDSTVSVNRNRQRVIQLNDKICYQYARKSTGGKQQAEADV